MATIKDARGWLDELGREFRVSDDGKDNGGFDTLTVELFSGPHSADITFKEPSPVYPVGSLYCRRGCGWASFTGELTRGTWDLLVADFVRHEMLCDIPWKK